MEAFKGKFERTSEENYEEVLKVMLVCGVAKNGQVFYLVIFLKPVDRSSYQYVRT